MRGGPGHADVRAGGAVRAAVRADERAVPEGAESQAAGAAEDGAGRAGGCGEG